MRWRDYWMLVWEAIRGQRLRSALTMLGIAIGVATMVLLAGVGEGTRQGLVRMFSQFGTTLVAITPGKSEAMGGGMGAVTGTIRRLTIDDIEALARVPGVRGIAGGTYGTARVQFGRRFRDVFMYGFTPSASAVLRWNVRVGRFLPAGDPKRAPSVCVLGAKAARELFGNANPLGAPVRVGEARLRVIGVMEPKGTMLGFDLDDTVVVPIALAQMLLNRFEVHEIDVDVAQARAIDRVAKAMTRELKRRHDDHEDFTIVTQDAMLEVTDNVLRVVTGGVLAIAAIAVLVGAIGILTVVWLSVHERTGEIGLCKAVGASDRQVLALFLFEAVGLALMGGVAGAGVGLFGGWGLTRLVPGLQVAPSPTAVIGALVLSMIVGALAGWIPARRAARLDPIQALRQE